MPTVRNATSADIKLIQDLAEKTWWPTYSSIITSEQIRYMLDTIYSAETIQQAMSDGSQHFLILDDEHGPQGFAAFGRRKEDPSTFKLHKIYILPENHGKGYGKLLIHNVCDRIARQGSHTLDLNVNRHNPAKTFYERMGFKVIREEDISIGPYWMNDYVMRLVISH
jgi:ribosomal protein S18 acetylase RimI-like enzyme